MIVEGFLPPPTLIEYLKTASCVVGKPGPGVVSEAAVLGVPFVTEQTDETMEQERCVLEYIRALGIGLVVPRLEGPYPHDLLERLHDCRAALREVENRAVFEVSAACIEAARAARLRSGRDLALEVEGPMHAAVHHAAVHAAARTREIKGPSREIKANAQALHCYCPASPTGL